MAKAGVAPVDGALGEVGAVAVAVPLRAGWALAWWLGKP